MPRQCSVISCSSIKSKQAVHLFKVRDSDFYACNEIIRKVNGNSNRKVVYVCAEHFSNDDLITHYNGPNDLEKVKRHLVGLRKGAIPSIFDTSIDITENFNTVTLDLPDPSGKSTLTTEPFRKHLLTIDDFFNNKSIDFPCKIHKKEVLSHIVSNFIIMRMRQYSLISNKNKPKINAKKKSLLNWLTLNVYNI